MKSILVSALLLSSILIGCQKNNDIAPPESSFKINNESNKTVSEGQMLDISNLSKNAVSYNWDFGNGRTSTDKIPVFGYGMHGDYTITLTVTSKDGKTAVYTEQVTVLCIFGSPNHPALM